MMGRMNMGKQIADAPSSKGVKKMFGGGMASMTPSMLGKGSKSRGGPNPPPGGAAAGFGSALAKLGAPKVGASGAVRGMAKGGKIDGCCMKGKTKGKMV